MSTKFIRLSDVRGRYSLSKSTIYDLISKGDFPAPIHIGRSSLWSIDQLDLHDAALLANNKAEVCHD